MSDSHVCQSNFAPDTILLSQLTCVYMYYTQIYDSYSNIIVKVLHIFLPLEFQRCMCISYVTHSRQFCIFLILCLFKVCNSIQALNYDIKACMYVSYDKLYQFQYFILKYYAFYCVAVFNFEYPHENAYQAHFILFRNLIV